jgi:glycosyltransferase involved in cell wall biosynthesis
VKPPCVGLIGHVGNSLLVRGGLEILLNITADVLRARGCSVVRQVREASAAPDLYYFMGGFYGLSEAFDAARGRPRIILPLLLHADASLAWWRPWADAARSFLPVSLQGERGRMLRQADAVLASSEFEAVDARRLGARRVEVVKLGVDVEMFRPDQAPVESLPHAWQERARAWLAMDRRCLSVARFEARKNQREVAVACRSRTVPALFIGRRSPVEPMYLDEVAREAGPLAQVWEDAPLEVVRWAFAVSDVHVLASRHETTGMVSLEAAASGCRPVAIEQPTAREYLDPLAVLAASPSPSDLELAIEAAFARGRLSSAELELVRREKSWAGFADRHLQIFDSMISGRPDLGRMP